MGFLFSMTWEIKNAHGGLEFMKKLGWFALALFLAAPAFALEVGDSAPCVELNDVQPNGTVINQCIRTHQANQSFTMLEFFATTCSDCAENLPNVSALEKQISGTTTVRLVGIDRSADVINAYITAHRDLIQFPVALDIDRDATKTYGVTATPTVFVLDAKNKVIYKHIGVFSDQDDADIQALVK
jgi:peroxiredoxin